MRYPYSILASLALVLTGPIPASADDVTIPNVFQAGTPARAAEVNGNFSAVEASVDDNALNVTDTAQALAAVSANIDANTTNIAAVAQAVSALAGGPNYEFVGFSTATVNGGVGYFGMNAACQGDFGPAARMATTLHIIESTIQPSLTTSGAWARAVFLAGTVIDVSGVAPPANFSCMSWSNTNTWGFGVTATGVMGQLLCVESLQVACAAPQ